MQSRLAYSIATDAARHLLRVTRITSYKRCRDLIRSSRFMIRALVLLALSRPLLIACSQSPAASDGLRPTNDQDGASVKSVAAATVTSSSIPIAASTSSPALTPSSDQPTQEVIAEPTTSRPYDPPVAVLVTRDDPQLPSGCRPWQVAGLITSFFDAFNRGDQDQLARFWMLPKASDAQGQTWYSVTEDDPKQGGRHFVAYNQSDLLAYFAKRIAQRERLQLVMVDVGQGRGGDVGVSYVLVRQADDLKPGLGGPERFAEGKGEINCKKQMLFVWSMAQNSGTPEEIVPFWPCPKPPDWSPGTSAIACSRS